MPFMPIGNSNYPVLFDSNLDASCRNAQRAAGDDNEEEAEQGGVVWMGKAGWLLLEREQYDEGSIRDGGRELLDENAGSDQRQLRAFVDKRSSPPRENNTGH
jgi:hypothetical protein